MSISHNSTNLGLDTKRHSFAHLMAAAVYQMFPEAQFGVGPVIEKGCFYDFVLPRTLIPEDIPLIEKHIKDLLKRNLVFKRQEVSLEEAITLFTKMNQPLKVELLNDLATRGTTSMSEEERADFENSPLEGWQPQTGGVDLSPNSQFYQELEQRAKDLGKQIVVELIITNEKGEVFAQRRSLTRKLYPGCWNLVGGHVEDGDTIYQTIEKELGEETGWKLKKIQNYLGEWIWTPEKDGTQLEKISYIFEIKVNEEQQPVLEEDKADKFIWVNKDNIDVVLENQETGGTYIYDQIRRFWEKKTTPSDLLSATTQEGKLPTITIYRLEDEDTGEDLFVDLCKGPHVELPLSRGLRGCGFSLDKFSASYWRGDQKRDIRMQRIYALVFDTVEELSEFQSQREEAKKRDHRVLNETQKYYTISDLVGSGLALFQPKGNIIRKIIQNYLWQMHKNKGYLEVWTPHIAKEALYQTSGHAKHYLDDMFSVYGGTSKENFYLKPMNCPHHMQLFADNQFSYKDMPIRYFEHATVYRDEKTGQLSGLTRVRNITQDDGHLFCRLNQLNQEIETIVEIIKEFMATFGMIPKWVSLSVRDNKDGWLGTDNMWNIAEKALKEAAIKHNIPYKIVEGEAAFYGPKLDFMFTDVIGRQQQLSTVQVDFNLPERFDLSFINEEGDKERPVVVHRAISGSSERFMGVLIEQFAGRFPFWFAPTQIKILTINNSEEVLNYTKQIQEILKDTVLMKPVKYNELRYELDERQETLGKKIREAEMQKIPVIMIVGPKDIAENQVCIRTQEGESKVKIDELRKFLELLRL